MASNAGRNEFGQEGSDSDRSAEPAGRPGAPAFSDEGMRRIVYAQDRDRRSEVFSEDTAELEADLEGRRRLVPMVIACAALISFGAIVWYAYSWGTGQMAGDQLPVVTAEVRPEKSRPEQPGGMEVPHQDKLVLNNGEPEGGGPVVERLLPPPEAPKPPEPLPAVPEPGAAVALPIPAIPEPPVEAPLAEGGGESGALAEAPATAELPPNVPEALQTETGEERADLPPRVDAETGIALPQMKPAASDQAGSDTSGDSASAPAGKPGGEARDQIAELLASPPLETANGPSGAAAAGPKAGDIVLQLSSVKSEAAAAAEWGRLQAAHPGLLGDMPLALDTAQVKGSTYYRVQTGPFESRSAAAAICGQLKARNQDCLVKQR